jgi:hypothetical protein
MSDELIARLSEDLRPAARSAVARRLLAGLGAGFVASLLLVLAVLGARPDLMTAAGQGMFWVKLGYAASFAAIAVWACERLARPGAQGSPRLAWIAAPVALLAALAAWRLGSAPQAAHGGLLMGHSARLCPWLILAASVPPLAGLVWALRGLAPTRLRLAGLAVGLAAGGAGAAAYAMHCDEMAAPFLIVWYSLGVMAAGGLGWLLGPRLLRW